MGRIPSLAIQVIHHRASRPGKLALGGSRRNLEQQRNLFVSVPFDIVENEHRPRPRCELCNGTLQFQPLDDIRWIGPGANVLGQFDQLSPSERAVSLPAYD